MITSPRTVRFGRTVGALPLAAVLALAACGGSPAAEPEPSDDTGAVASEEQPWEGLTGAEREQALLEAAADEGALSVYSGYNDEQEMADAFMEKYDLDVEVYSANSETVLQRVLQERDAGRTLNDVLIGPSPDIQVAEDDDLLAVYESEYRDAVSERGKGENWTGVRRLAFVAGWNTDALDAAEIPDDYSGFADPEWEGRISMELSDYDWYMALRDHYIEQGMSEEEVDEMFAAMAANSETVKGHTVQGELLAAGEYDAALSLYSQTVERAQEQGAPLTYGAEEGAIVEPVVLRYDAGAVMEGTDNPAGAALYLDFQLSEDGFAVDEELGALPPVAQDEEPFGDAEVIELDTPAFVEQRTEISAAYDELLRAGSQVG